MAAVLHAIDYLAAPQKHPPRPVCVVFGEELFLKRQVLMRLREAVLGGDEGGFSFREFDASAPLGQVLDELETVAMFGGGRRLVLVSEADEFVTRWRGDLEQYLARPCSTGVLVLDVKSWPSNTRLYKQTAAEGLVIDSSAPGEARLKRWLIAWAKQAHKVQLDGQAAELLQELVGPEPGLLDQELAKLASAAGPGGKVTPETVRQFVGSWRTQTTWQMLDAALDGDIPGALLQLDRLLLSGESPVALLGQVSYSLRRFAAATQLVLQAEAAGHRISPRDALVQTGTKTFLLPRAETQLRRLGRQRGDQLYQWLLETDLALKGESEAPPRVVLERLLVRLGGKGK
jgi:DNA polymerase-3 subunit delta